MDRFSLKGDVAFITGAGSGIGQAIAIGMAESGADIALFDLKVSDGLLETKRKVEEAGQKAICIAGSVTVEDDLVKAIDQVEEELGSLTIAVNSAGIADANPAEKMELSQWQKMIDVDLTGVFLSCKAEANAMLKRKKGAIINIASMSGSIANHGLNQVHYNSAKAGVIHLTKSLAMEWVDRGIRVNAISPGYTASPMNIRPEVAEQVKLFESETPMARMASCDEMAGPAIFLASNAASYCTGIDLLVDGGFTCW